MTRELNDVYGKVNMDYANEFNEYDVEHKLECIKNNECQKECNDELNTGGCQST
jgi:hypothetical protein